MLPLKTFFQDLFCLLVNQPGKVSNKYKWLKDNDTEVTVLALGSFSSSRMSCVGLDRHLVLCLHQDCTDGIRMMSLTP